MAIDKSFVVTTDSIEGYKIVKYLGVIGALVSSSSISFSPKNMPESFDQHIEPLIKRAEELGANAIVGMRILSQETVSPYHPTFYGTAVLVEPITQ